MTKDDIIRMAHDAGLHLATDVNWMPIIGLEYAEKFANLVAAAEREACETAVEDLARKYQQAHEVSAENVADACAYAIRLRGDT
jgi:hypothetical protein